MSNFYAMKGGDGAHSYAHNSSYQMGAIISAEEILKDEIAKHLDIKQLSTNSTQTLRIADFGCSTGPNTFFAVQIIIDTIVSKFKTELLDTHNPEIQVFFNDDTSNDFNTLFASLPPERRYHAAGVPGSFYIRLFPKASLHFAISSSTLCWLSEIPKEITDENSCAWNKGRIHYGESNKEVFDAYSAQFSKDFETFLNARAEELVSGGLIALIIHAAPDDMNHSHITTGTEMDLLGSCLMDMAKMGRFDETMVDKFNLPIYYTFPDELKKLLERNKYFNIEKMETLKNTVGHNNTMPKPKSRALFLRATLEGVLEKHFGTENMDELFSLYEQKVAKSSFFLNPNVHRSIHIFVLLKRIGEIVGTNNVHFQ